MADGAGGGEAGDDPERTLWSPWTRTPSSVVYLHEFCQLYPAEGWERRAEPPWSDDDRELRYLRGYPRAALRHTPLAVFLVLLLIKLPQFVVFGLVEPLDPSWLASWPLVGSLDVLPRLAVVAAVVVAWIATLGWLLARKLRPTQERALRPEAATVKAAVVYVTLGVLVAGSAYAVLTTWRGGDPGVIGDFGFWLMIFLGGLLVYDGMLRTERLLWRLEERRLVRNDAAYREFRDRLAAALDPWADTVWGVPAAYLFVGLFVLPFVFVDVVEFLGRPGGLSAVVGPGGFLLELLRAGFNLFIVLVAFQFVVLLWYFHVLVTDGFSGEHGRIGLEYDPFHRDQHGGFRDLGRFATRVNLILVVGGLYLVYQMYVGDVFAFASIAPLIVYAGAAGAWLYYSFWMMHKEMVAGRERWLSRLERPSGDRAGPSGPEGNRPDWSAVRDAPVWPINRGQMQRLVSANVMPVLLALPGALLGP